MEFRLPELGEGITSATVVNVLVKPGDRVKADQPLLEVETDKAAVPIPSPADGTVREVRVKQGQTVSVGSVLAVLTTQQESRAPQKAAAPPAAAAAGKQSVPSRPAAAVAENGPVPDHLPVAASPATRRFARELG